jgi:hypothetical protein
MSDFYHRFRAEVTAGGAVDEAVSPMATRNGKTTGIIMEISALPAAVII